MSATATQRTLRLFPRQMRFVQSAAPFPSYIGGIGSGKSFAGAAKVIAANIGPVLKTAVQRVSNCDCGEETSCYGCLRTYRNSREHELLSRGAALKLLGEVI